MSMKIFILTQPLHTNFGGTLQAYALQYTLRQLGHNPLTINYRKKESQVSTIRLLLSRLKQKIINGKIVYSFNDNERNIISKYHNDFIEKYINYTSPIYESSVLGNFVSSGKFDAVIVGSDQTWRPKYSPDIGAFFLDFLSGNGSIKKISYASSFGTDDWEFTHEQTKQFSHLLNEFDYVSVREQSAVKLCEEHFGITPKHVLDPTLLLDINVYMKLIECLEPRHCGEVFNYVLDKSQDKNDIIEHVCTFLGKDSFSTSPKNTLKENKHIQDYSGYIYPRIESWLRSFYDADYIITDSFHGTVFSIIFNKPFISIGNEARGNARFKSLLEMFNLEHRLVSNKHQITYELVSGFIDYESVNMKLEKLKNDSLTYLRRSLEF